MSIMPSLFANRQFQVIAFVQIMLQFATNLLNPVLPVHFKLTGLNESQIGFVMGIVSLGALLVRPWAGTSADVRGSRFTLLCGQAMTSAGIAAYLFVSGFWPLLVVRFFQGTALAFSGTGAITFASSVGTRETTTAAIAYYALCTMIGLGLGTSAGPLVYNAAGFTPIIAASLTAALCALAAMWLYSQPTPPRAGETRAPFRAVLASKVVLAPSVCLFASNFTLGTAFTFVPLLALARGIGSFSAFFLAFSTAVVLSRLGVQAINNRLGSIKTSAVAGMVNAAGALLLAAVPSTAAFAVAGVLIGTGFGIIFPTLAGYLVRNVGEANRGSALSVLSGAGDIGNALGASVLGIVAQTLGFTAVFAADALVILVCTGYFYTVLRNTARE